MLPGSKGGNPMFSTVHARQKGRTTMPTTSTIRVFHWPEGFDELTCGAAAILIEDGQPTGLSLLGTLHHLDDAHDVEALRDLAELLAEPRVQLAIAENLDR